jgi:high-affinity Fe2+/Pb2+ permease
MSRADDQLRAWATGSLSVEGQINQVGMLAHGLTTNRRGRRRAGIALALAAAVVLLAVLVAFLAF